MGKKAITYTDGGTLVDPSSRSDWEQWVSASRTRNHVLEDPLLDWLDRYGESKGFVLDVVEERTDFVRFIMAKGIKFERAVVEHLEGLGLGQVLAVGAESGSQRPSWDLGLAEETWKAMSDGVEIICQGVLRDPEHKTYGMPDLLVRSDVLAMLFPGSLSSAQAAVAAGDLPTGSRHYVVVDIKYTTLRLLAGGGLGASGSNAAYKVQLHIYNRALARIQGYLPPRAFLLGRGWTQTKKGQQTRVNSCMDNLAPVSHNEVLRGGPLGDHADRAAEWLRRMRQNGQNWDALPAPTVNELRPNAKGEPGEWSSAVKKIIERTEDLTALWNVSAAKRRDANAKGLTSWRDPKATPEALGVTGDVRTATLRALLAVNRSAPPQPKPAADLTAVRPKIVTAQRSQWAPEPSLEFFVDYETVSDIDDDFSKIPYRGGQPLIFMIGCGHIEAGAWHFECFIADDLTEPSEAVVIDHWLEHMANVRDRVAPGSDPRVIHWSGHEQSTLETAYNAATQRHPQRSAAWASPNWFDLLKEAIKAQPVVVRGAHGFGLKAMTNAMHRAGLVATQWTDGPADGLGAMVAAWSCQKELQQGATGRLEDLDLMQQVRDYNETDCRAMREILEHLRKHH